MKVRESGGTRKRKSFRVHSLAFFCLGENLLKSRRVFDRPCLREPAAEEFRRLRET